MAAGLGFKDFVTGEVLTAADVDGYLMQNIWVFANAAARDAAVTSPQEGNACYLKDTDAVMTYSGSAWVSASAPASYGLSAGKNAIINGAFDIWQRGTTNVTTLLVYTADRWQKGLATHFGISRTTVSDTTNLPTIQYAARMQRTNGSATTSVMDLGYSMESADSTKFIGQTVTLSFYARKGANYSGAAGASFNFALYTGTGTDQSIMTSYTGGVAQINSSATLTTSMARYTASVTIPTTATEIGLYFNYTPTGTAGANDYVDITGVQLELGSSATTFSRNAGTIQGELAACQRYYRRWTTVGTYGVFGLGTAISSTRIDTVFLLSPMRIAPTSIDYNSNVAFTADQSNIVTQSALTLSSGTGGGNTTLDSAYVTATVSGATQFRPYIMLANANASAYIGFSAEL
jgi:hypothetical protein